MTIKGAKAAFGCLAIDYLRVTTEIIEPYPEN